MLSKEIVVVDYHRVNLQSVVRGLSAVGGFAVASDDPKRIASAAGLVLPGVGAFEDAMSFLRQSGEADAILSSIGEGTPFLGICLGLHLLFERSQRFAQAKVNRINNLRLFNPQIICQQPELFTLTPVWVEKKIGRAHV